MIARLSDAPPPLAPLAALRCDLPSLRAAAHSRHAYVRAPPAVHRMQAGGAVLILLVALAHEALIVAAAIERAIDALLALFGPLVRGVA